MKPPPSHVLWRPFAGLLPLLITLTGLGLPARTLADQITLINLTNTVWRFNDSGVDLGTDWRAVNYPAETNWTNGVGLFGIDTTERIPPLYPAPFQTPMVLGGRITYYFRTRFFLPQDPGSNIVSVTTYVDDGAVFYVNGVEVSRTRLPTNPVLFNTRAELANPEGLPAQFDINPANLLLGTNTMAVEVHQQNENSADVVFGLEMVATGTAAPEILDPTQPADAKLNQGESTTFSVVGSGIPAPDYRWYFSTNALIPGATISLIPGASGPTLTILADSQEREGTYFAVLSNSLGTATSRVAKLTVMLDTIAPAILFALARDLTHFYLPVTEPLNSVSATDEFNWAVLAADGSDSLAGGLLVVDVRLEDQTNITIITLKDRDPMKSYVVSNGFDIEAPFGPGIPANTMTPVAIFPVELISSSNVWRFEHSGTDLGTNWSTTGFNDAAWSSGPAPLDAFRALPTTPEPHCRPDGILPGTGGPVGTCLMTLSNADNTAQISTAYFRTRFNFGGDAAHSVLSIQPILVDDAAVFYLNGKELFRLGMSDGPVTYATLAGQTVGNATPDFREIGSGGLVEGENVLAVEVHQDTLSSPDLTFGATVTALVPKLVQQARRLSSTLAGGNITITWEPGGGQLQSATEIGGPWLDVQSSQTNQHTEPATGERKFYRVAP